MPAARTIARYLKNLDAYLAQFRHQESVCFEQLTAFAFSQVLSLPFYDLATDDTLVPHRVVWQGNSAGGTLSKAPAGSPDIIAYSCGFWLIIEATRKTGANQWTQEFAQAVRHCSDFVRANSLDPRDVYIVLATPELHVDTYRSLQNRPRVQYPIIPLDTFALREMLDTSILAFTMKNLELRGLFHSISDCVKRSATIEEFQKELHNDVTRWQKDVLRREKGAFIGVKSYEAMKKIRRPAVSVSEIFEKLITHPFVGQYLKIIGEKLSIAEIETVLVDQSLGCCSGRTIQTGERLFERVPGVDFKHRGSILIGAVEEISQRPD